MKRLFSIFPPLDFQLLGDFPGCMNCPPFLLPTPMCLPRSFLPRTCTLLPALPPHTIPCQTLVPSPLPLPPPPHLCLNPWGLFPCYLFPFLCLPIHDMLPLPLALLCLCLPFLAAPALGQSAVAALTQPYYAETAAAALGQPEGKCAKTHTGSLLCTRCHKPRPLPH